MNSGSDVLTYVHHHQIQSQAEQYSYFPHMQMPKDHPPSLNGVGTLTLLRNDSGSSQRFHVRSHGQCVREKEPKITAY